MSGTIIDLQSFRNRRSQRAALTSPIDSRPPTDLADSARPDPWSHPTTDEPAQTDPYTVQGAFLRRQELVRLLTDLAKRYQSGFDASLDEALQSVTRIEESFHQLLPSLSDQRARRLAGEAAMRVVGAVNSDITTQVVIERIVTAAMIADRRAKGRSDRRQRQRPRR